MTAVTPSRSGVSPSSSPRLPSPPPIPEVQYGPQSPGVDLSKELSLDATSKPDEGAARRIRPGTKAADMAMGPPLVPLSQLDSPFQLQEHLKSLYSHLTHSPESTNAIPVTKESALELATPPQVNDIESVDRNLWLYELCRFLTQKANMVSIFLMNDNPPCSSATCPEMRASEWQYLCAVHEPPKSCCAIDYCNHTLDWAANVLTSPKHFPSRLALGGEAGNALQSMRQLTNIFRRVYRIFAHAWFQHRDVFWSIELTYGQYMFFKVVCDEYRLIPEDSYTIPPEAEGRQETPVERETGLRPQVVRKEIPPSLTPEDPSSAAPSSATDHESSTTVSTGATTRRHKHTPSTGSHVATIAEGQEEEEEQPTSTISIKPSGPSAMPQLVQIPPGSTEGKSVGPLTKQNEESKIKQSSPLDRLPKLDITSTVPKYEPHAPADPTPTGNGENIDPMSIDQTAQPPSYTASATDASNLPKDEAAKEGIHPETTIEQVGKPPKEDEADHTVTSPSGGSIRTGGSDLLKTILVHMHDGEEDRSSVAENAEPEPSSFALRDVEQNASKDSKVEANDENETMSPVLMTTPMKAETGREGDVGIEKARGDTRDATSPDHNPDEKKDEAIPTTESTEEDASSGKQESGIAEGEMGKDTEA